MIFHQRVILKKEIYRRSFVQEPLLCWTKINMAVLKNRYPSHQGFLRHLFAPFLLDVPVVVHSFPRYLSYECFIFEGTTMI
jgi:hypothetical protein